jgi:hypothetical protein
MRNVKNVALVIAATGGILFAAMGPASADTKVGGDNFPILSNFNNLEWDDSPFCGFQIKTEDSKQKTSCPVVHQENSTGSKVVIINE